MAWDNTQIISLPAGTTFAESDLYKAVEVSSTGGAIRYGTGGSTGGGGWIGTLYSVTSTTNAGEAVQIGVGPVIKVFAAKSTASYGNLLTASTADGHFEAPGSSDDSARLVNIVGGSSGSTGRILTGVIV